MKTRKIKSIEEVAVFAGEKIIVLRQKASLSLMIIKISLTTEINPAGNIIHFRDSAGGASAEIVNHLFDGYKTTKEKGTGIGLAFCKMTMESFGGNITCHSVEGDYIEFVMTFPINPTD